VIDLHQEGFRHLVALPPAPHLSKHLDVSISLDLFKLVDRDS
jgi:hypothetical protein